MKCKDGHKKPKQLPYGSTKGKYWCSWCDGELVPEWYGPKSKNIKKKARQKAKREIKEFKV